MNKRKIPLRKCLGCGERKDKKDLIRIVKTPDKKIVIDLKGNQNGRGAYICNNRDCFDKMVESNKISKSLKADISKEKLEELKNEIKAN